MNEANAAQSPLRTTGDSLFVGKSFRKVRELTECKERWLSGRKRRFAKSVNRETGSAGSNPVRSAFRFDIAQAITKRGWDWIDDRSSEGVAQSVEQRTFNP